jgi:DNA polymerase-3 subunit delta
MQAVEYLKSPDEHAIGPAVAVFGPDGYLRGESIRAVIRQLFPEEDAEAGPVRMPGRDVDLRNVFDTLRTVSMWSDRQLVIVEDADDFVSDHRAELEKYLEKPAKKGVLLLDLKSFPSNTRLAKKVASIGLPLECKTPEGVPLFNWLADYAKRTLGKKLDREAAAQLVELAGKELGLLVQELAKLATYVGKEPAISKEAVEALVGGWRMRTTWEMLDAVIDGRAGEALQMFDKLLENGEAVQMILGAVNWRFRPLAQANDLVRQGQPLSQALTEAGVKPFSIRPSEAYLRRIGSRANQISGWLLKTDTDLKGGSGFKTEHDRVLLERLLVTLAGR